MNDKKEQVIADLRDMGIGMFDTVPVATYNRMVRKRDEAVAENLRIAEMYRVVVKQLADAPHDSTCLGWTLNNPCTCWKAGL
jgi:hypothetical protein